MKQHLIVMSADALVSEDMEKLCTLPNFRKYLSGGAQVKKIRSIYPTITYPCHVTMETGTYPSVHGITGNYELQPGVKKLPWKWFCDDVKVPGIFAAAKKAGLTTASVFWPVTGNNKNIDYLIDEYWTQGKEDNKLDMFRRSGSNEQVMEIIEKYVGDLAERKHPSADNFIINCASDIIRKFKPHLLMLHPANIDDYRHATGVFSDKISKGVDETDEWIGALAEACIEAGIWNDTNFVLVSDHGQLDIKRVINLNVFFADKGYITLNESGKVTDWRVWCQSGGMSCNVYLKNPDDEKLKSDIYNMLCQMRDDGIYGFGEVFTKKEAFEKEQLLGDFEFILETDGYTAFGDSPVRPIVRNFDSTDYRYGRATHGYLPEKGPQPVFAANGPAIMPGAVLENGRLIDEAPTFAKILGVSLPHAQGTAMTELLKGD